MNSQSQNQTENKKLSLENEFKMDWIEMIPAVGLIKCLAINYDYAKKMRYKGWGGQFAKHVEQREEYNFARSIPIGIILYGAYQVSATYTLFQLLNQ